MITALRYLREDPLFEKEIPYELFGHPDQPSERLTNCHYDLHGGIQIEDVRDGKAHFSLETTGFQYVKHHTDLPLEARYFEGAGTEYKGDDVVTAYLKESIAFLEQTLQVDKVIVFDWRFRRSGAPSGQSNDTIFDIRLQALSPGLDVHCDFSQRGGMERLEMHLLPEELEMVKSGKYQARIINNSTWRPVRMVKNAPLVITDRRTVPFEHLMEVEKVVPDKVERAAYLLYRPQTKWYYMSNQTEDDVAVFTTWDSEQRDSCAGAPPHGAASHFDEKWATNPRESIEVRFIVLYPKEAQH